MMRCLILAACLCLISCQQEIGIENDYFHVSVVNPNDPELGYRFVRAGWLRGLRLKENGRELFHTASLFSYHPAFGFTREFEPEIALSGNRLLKIGVGIIEPHPGTRFRPKPVEIFPWHTKWHSDAAKTVLTAEQRSGEQEGYGYILRVNVTVPMDSPEIIYRETLFNTGKHTLEGMVYAHPFFDATEDFEGCRYWMPDLPGLAEVSTAENRTVTAESIPPDYRQVITETPAGRMTISSDRPLSQITFWKADKGCFAVEPFIAFRVEPGEKAAWEWRLTVSETSLISPAAVPRGRPSDPANRRRR